MRRLATVLIASLVCACRGEQVGADTPIVGDTSVLDATDASVGDASSPTDAALPTDVADADDCALVDKNLIENASFEEGLGPWTKQDAEATVVAGRCGRKALRIYDAKAYGRIEQRQPAKPFPKDTRLRLRAWFKRGSKPVAGNPPKIFVRWFAKNDAGVEDPINDVFTAQGSNLTTWDMTSHTFILPRAETGFIVFVERGFATGPELDEFEVADVSLVVVP